ncbi:Gfo/Idh/MocA family oxidoreductase [Novacetimonas hansenii]|uniref:D-galactose 1-dehydrogenase n=2 Tax=Novacetimonas hansenii TaxID=436 RepID=A0AAW5ESD2_NOVHA|nr:Gfo/Idh/MocA family oxidoreductase [Novacetimonas hansenii]EFG83171.1 galactose 1-dehydrogenase [Novacetimonas hansenii ATCC 23769]MBL7238572.1 Gfo/Idh/MocA family oxidoreductase [Novacetimonas hansenii]MCJ8354737.1 Gfo/Idh/MocA family oxidoreductase [Novacetimonas hansenii]PYD71601.1 gfo/Idh/MocA family oxidoreductase [Novacetimonas hansenii]QOF95598.1 Gfo/Idh/MocA family oxidoreductase [Novacetimonas hansenii]
MTAPTPSSPAPSHDTSRPIRIAIIGTGTIANTQHVPVIRAHAGFELVAGVNPTPVTWWDAATGDAKMFSSLTTLIQSGTEVDAVAICTPPATHYALAAQALAAGWHVMLEKPPTPILSQAMDLHRLARNARRTLMTSWHAACAPAIAPARQILSANGMRAMRITWRENVQKWHPGANWFWKPGGHGVFDAGINALSIACAVMDDPLFVRDAILDIPAGAATPCMAQVQWSTPSLSSGVEGIFDWTHRGLEVWDIAWTLNNGRRLLLSQGGGGLSLDGVGITLHGTHEYECVYSRFESLVHAGACDIEYRPVALVEDILSTGQRRPAEMAVPITPDPAP